MKDGSGVAEFPALPVLDSDLDKSDKKIE